MEDGILTQDMAPAKLLWRSGKNTTSWSAVILIVIVYTVLETCFNSLLFDMYAKMEADSLGFIVHNQNRWPGDLYRNVTDAMNVGW